MVQNLDLTDNQSSTTHSVPDFFISEANSKSEKSSPTYLKAIRSLTSWVNSRNAQWKDPAIFTEWLVSIWNEGVTFSTAKLYLDAISSLVNCAVTQNLLKTESSEEIARLKAILKHQGEEIWRKKISPSSLKTLPSLLKTPIQRDSELSLAVDLLLFKIISPQSNPETITTAETQKLRDNLCRENLNESVDAIDGIVTRRASSRRKYLFDLNQSRLTPRQLLHEVNRRSEKIAGKCGIYNKPELSSIAALSRVVRGLTGLKIGLTAEEIAGIDDQESRSQNQSEPKITDLLPILKLVKPESLEESTDLSSLSNNLIVSTLLENPFRWFAMRLRARVGLKEIEERIEDIRNEIATPTDLFYPHEEIAKRVGKKLIFRKKPFINDVVFIRSRRTDLITLFSKIGDLAWGYTVTSLPGSPYAAIPDSQFTKFQTAIGRFTKEDDPQPLGTLMPRPGEPVIFLAGPFQGRQAIIEEAETVSNSPTLIYRLKLTADNGLEWRVKADSRTLRALRTKPNQTSF